MRLTFRVLEAFARARLAVLLALLHARIAREQALGFQRRPQRRVKFDQRAGDAVPHGAGLAVGPPPETLTRTSNFSAVPVTVSGCVAIAPQGFQGEIIFKRPAVDGDFAGAGSEAHAGDGGFAPAVPRNSVFCFGNCQPLVN